MEWIVLILVFSVVGLVVGSLARLAVPGPDPMSIWRTILLGILGALLGGALAGLLGFEGGGGLLFAVVGGALILIAYRRFRQGRGITGPSARRAP